MRCYWERTMRIIVGGCTKGLPPYPRSCRSNDISKFFSIQHVSFEGSACKYYVVMSQKPPSLSTLLGLRS